MKTTALPSLKSRINLDANDLGELTAVLNQQLADTFDMLSLIKQAHWNIKGPNFIALHKMLDEFAVGMTEYVDMLAERITALGGLAMGTVRMSAQATRLQPYPAELVEEMATVAFLAEQMAQLADSTRAAAERAENLNDMSTNDLFIEISRDLDKWLWFLDAHIPS